MMNQPSHVFIVGSGRSGTTLMTKILNRSRDIAVCGETRFLIKGPYRPGLRRTFSKIGDLKTDQGAKRVVEYIYHGFNEKSFWNWIRNYVDKELFLKQLLASERTDRALFDLVMTLYARDKPIRGEKTPAHIYCVRTLLEWFPQGKIIHIIRDPRAVFISKKIKIAEKKWDAFHYRLVRGTELSLNIYLSFAIIDSWLGCVRRHYQYLQTYPDRYYLMRFEDLINTPKPSLERLCDFLGIALTDDMLQQKVVNSSFGTPDTWTYGFDISASNRWRNLIPSTINRWFIFRCKKYLRAFGYLP